MKIKINGKYINFFNDIKIGLTLDSVASAFSFTGRYNPSNKLHREVFKPLSYAKVEILDNDDNLLLTGTIVSHTFNSKETPELWKLSGYSKAGILEDVNISYSQYPLESLKRNLKDITERLVQPLGINVSIDNSVINDAKIVFEKSVADPTESIKNYISKIASQRNIFLSHNAKGDILFFKPNIKSLPKFFFTKENTLSMSLNTNGQGLHSEITVLRQPSDDDANVAPVDTVKNPLVSLKRSSVKILSSGTDVETKKAANNELAAELKNIEIKVSINKILKLSPGDIVEVKNDEIFISEKIKLMVNSVNIQENNQGESTSVSLMLPETFTGDQPKNIFK